MGFSDYVIHLIISGIVIVGGHQFYFFTQRHTLVKVRVFHSSIDEEIPFWPWWSWIYSFLYYPTILYLNWLVEEPRQFVMMAFSFIVLLVMQMSFFALFPVSTPKHWHDINRGHSWFEKFLWFVQKFDGALNCFPVCMFRWLHLSPYWR